MNGGIEVKSIVDSGSEFIIKLFLLKTEKPVSTQQSKVLPLSKKIKLVRPDESLFSETKTNFRKNSKKYMKTANRSQVYDFHFNLFFIFTTFR